MKCYVQKWMYEMSFDLFTGLRVCWLQTELICCSFQLERKKKSLGLKLKSSYSKLFIVILSLYLPLHDFIPSPLHVHYSGSLLDLRQYGDKKGGCRILEYFLIILGF